MEVRTENREVGRHGTTEERQFNIKGSAKAFKILSDGLYSNKILAVIRELSCNAKDAHIDAGKEDVPFEIHLPNTLEPWFAVTDYGIGLSHDDVMHLYSTYFESTKTDSNNVTGCLGLGSKSPFAYADMFTVEARWNGKTTLYSCFYNEAGIPSINVLSEPFDTDQPNGLTVKIAVEERDMRDFAKNAASALRRFIPMPTVTGNTDYEIKTIKYRVEGSNWKMLDGDSPYGTAKVNAIQGNVTYPIDQYSLGTLTDAQDAVMALSVDIFFDIGKLDVAANREALGYDEATIKNIKAALDVIAEEVAPLFQSKFDDCKTLWEARVLFKEVINDLPHGLRGILSDKNVGLKWHKQPLNEYFVLSTDTFKEEIVQFQNGYRGNRGSSVSPNHLGNHSFDASDDSLFFYDDVGHGSHSRMTYFLETTARNDCRYAYLIKPNKGSTLKRKTLKAFSKALGNVKLQPLSNLPARPKAERAIRQAASKVMEYVGKAHDRRDSWVDTTLDLKSGGFYVMINRYKVFNGTEEVSDFDGIVSMAKDNDIIDLTDKTIYGIRKGDVAKLPADAGWVELFGFINTTIKDIVATEQVESILSDYQAFRNFDFSLSAFVDMLLSETFDTDSPMAAFTDAYTYMRDRRTDRASSIASMAGKIRYSIQDDAKPTHDLDTFWNAVIEQYPMISLIDAQCLRGGYYRNSGAAETNFATLMDYIRTVDTTRAAEDDAND